MNLRREAQGEVVQTFRDYYNRRHHIELGRVSLVSHHDPSILFTNSTTSVMKPLFVDVDLPAEPAYLAQPAMGQQGLHYWKKDHTFGPYASYFASLGALYPVNRAEDSVEDIIAIPQALGASIDRLSFAVHESDEDLAKLIEAAGIPFEVHSDEGDFRHTYGLDNITGRNINIEMENKQGVRRTLGNLTLIQAAEKGPVAYEVSFDSTTATALVQGLGHPVEAHYLPYGPADSDESIVAVDTLSVSAALLSEGLRPVSRGRSGVLRKFLLEFLSLSKKQHGLGDAALRDILYAAIDEEVVFRDQMSPAQSSSDTHRIEKGAIEDWMVPLIKRIETTPVEGS